MSRLMFPLLAAAVGYAFGLMHGRKDAEGNATLYWVLVAALVLVLLGGGVVLYKVAKNG